MTVPEALVQQTFRRYRLEAEPEQLERLAAYAALIQRWNEAVSLTSIREPGRLVLRHCAEPAMALSLLAGAGPRLVDAGSGAGAPGLPLKILCPEREVVLVEANTRKATFLREAIDELGLCGIDVCEGRLEQEVASGGLEGPFHVLTARAWTSGWGELLATVSEVMPEGARALLFVGEETLRGLRRELWTGTDVPHPRGTAWRRAAAAGWQLRRSMPLPHLDRAFVASLQRGRVAG